MKNWVVVKTNGDKELVIRRFEKRQEAQECAHRLASQANPWGNGYYYELRQEKS